MPAKLSIVTSRTRRLLDRPPRWPFDIDWDSDQSEDLLAAWPLVGDCPFVEMVTYRVGSGVIPSVVGSAEVDDSVTSFNGTTQYLSVPTIRPWNDGGYTFSIFFRQTSAVATFNLGVSATGSTLDRVGLNLTSGRRCQITVYQTGTSPPGEVASDAGPAFQLDNLYSHIATLTPGDSATVYRSRYGRGLESGGTTATIDNWPTTTLDRMVVGARHNSSVLEFFNGRLHDGRIYGRALSTERLEFLTNLGLRWELYYELNRRTFFLPKPVVGGAHSITGDVQNIIDPTATALSRGAVFSGDVQNVVEVASSAMLFGAVFSGDVQNVVEVASSAMSMGRVFSGDVQPVIEIASGMSFTGANVIDGDVRVHIDPIASALVVGFVIAGDVQSVIEVSSVMAAGYLISGDVQNVVEVAASAMAFAENYFITGDVQNVVEVAAAMSAGPVISGDVQNVVEVSSTMVAGYAVSGDVVATVEVAASAMTHFTGLFLSGNKATWFVQVRDWTWKIRD